MLDCVMPIRKANTNKVFNIGTKTYLFNARLNNRATGDDDALFEALPRNQKTASEDRSSEKVLNLIYDDGDVTQEETRDIRIKPVFNTYDGTTANNHSKEITTNRVGFLIRNDLFIPYFNATELAATYYPLTSLDNFNRTTSDYPEIFFDSQDNVSEGRGKPRVAFSLPGRGSRVRQILSGDPIAPLNDETEELQTMIDSLSELNFRNPFDTSFQPQDTEYVPQFEGISNPDTPLLTTVENYGDVINYYINVYTSGSFSGGLTVPPECPECMRKQFVPVDAGLCGPSGTESCTDIGHSIDSGPFYDTFRQAAEAIGFSFIGNEGDNENDGSNYDSSEVGLYVAGAELSEVIGFRRVPYSPAGKKLNFVECAEAAAQMTQFEISFGTEATLVEEIYATGQALVQASGRAKYPNAISHIICPTYWKFVT
jgi:hypothetical protein